MSPIITAVSIAVLFPLAALFVGWGLLRPVEDLDAEERLAAAFGIGIAVIAGTQFLVFATGLQQAQLALGVPLVALVGGLAAGRRRAGSALPQRLSPWLLLLFLLAYLQM